MKEYSLLIDSPIKMIDLGEKIGLLLQKNMVITLEGDLGAGKTTLTKGIAKGLEIEGIINSPTFTIMKIHKGRLVLYHMDVYRINNDSGDDYLEEYFENDGVCVIEWADNISSFLPNDRLNIVIKSISDDVRKVVISAPSKYEDLLDKLIRSIEL